MLPMETIVKRAVRSVLKNIYEEELWGEQVVRCDTVEEEIRLEVLFNSLVSVPIILIPYKKWIKIGYYFNKEWKYICMRNIDVYRRKEICR